MFRIGLVERKIKIHCKSINFFCENVDKIEKNNQQAEKIVESSEIPLQVDL